jgi:hypothetical protein
MFPAGAAGSGLLLLRLCVAGMLMRNCILDATSPVPVWEIIAIVFLAATYCFGAFTPITCGASVSLQLFVFLHIHTPNLLHFVFSFSITGALFLLGPGAYSLDSHLFGRRLIVHSSSN